TAVFIVTERLVSPGEGVEDLGTAWGGRCRRCPGWRGGCTARRLKGERRVLNVLRGCRGSAVVNEPTAARPTGAEQVARVTDLRFVGHQRRRCVGRAGVNVAQGQVRFIGD